MCLQNVRNGIVRKIEIETGMKAPQQQWQQEQLVVQQQQRQQQQRVVQQQQRQQLRI
jgi:hypothetical protein